MGRSPQKLFMKEQAKRFLSMLGIYHPLQSTYRRTIDFFRKQYYRISYGKWKGRGYRCNFCGSQYEKFVPEYPSPNTSKPIREYKVIAGYGKDVLCPNCLSKNRERLLKAVFEKLLPMSGQMLHFSPEKLLFQYLQTKGAVTSADLMPGFYRTIDQSIDFADATQLPYGNERFDWVIANHILEHIPNDRKAMSEMFRVLRKGGAAVLQVPYSETLPNTIEEPDINDPERQEQLFGQRDHVRIYALQDYLARLESVGFEVRVISAEELSQFRDLAIQENESVILGYKK